MKNAKQECKKKLKFLKERPNSLVFSFQIFKGKRMIEKVFVGKEV
jgi:hypothetical protein